MSCRTTITSESTLHPRLFNQKTITLKLLTIHFIEGDAQAQTPRSKNCAVITLSSLWNLTAPECDGLLNPRPAVFLITAESPPGKYAYFISPSSTSSIYPTFSLWVLMIMYWCTIIERWLSNDTDGFHQSVIRPIESPFTSVTQHNDHLIFQQTHNNYTLQL